MKGRIAGELPSPLGCIARRCIAKAVDVAIVVALAYLVALLLIGQPLSFDGLVPTIGSIVWLVTFFVAADVALVIAFGATFGELMTGLRVLTLEEQRLGLRQRQDRTQDALIEGTFGCFSLLSAFWRREPAPYDSGCTIFFSGLSRRHLLALLVIVTVVLLGATVAGIQIGIKGFEANAPVVLTRAMRYFGLDVRERWRNPLTGASVSLPKGWYVGGTDLWRYSDLAVYFRCRNDPCLVRLAVSPGFDFTDLDPQIETSPDGLEGTAQRLLDVDLHMHTLEDHPDVHGRPRLDKLYWADVAVGDDEYETPVVATALIWFTHGRDIWSVALVAPRNAEQRIDEATQLAFALIQATRQTR